MKNIFISAIVSLVLFLSFGAKQNLSVNLQGMEKSNRFSNQFYLCVSQTHISQPSKALLNLFFSFVFQTIFCCHLALLLFRVPKIFSISCEQQQQQKPWKASKITCHFHNMYSIENRCCVHARITLFCVDHRPCQNAVTTQQLQLDPFQW